MLWVNFYHPSEAENKNNYQVRVSHRQDDEILPGLNGLC